MSNPVTNSPLQRALILITVTLVTLLYAMTVTIANVALPQMQGALAATQDQIAWVVTFNIVATAVVTPLAGWLATRYGRRRLMLWSVLGFALSSLLCGLAGSLEALVLYRVMQGAFGAPLVPVSQAIVLDTYPKHQHGAATAVFGMGVIIGPILGPTLGDYLSVRINDVVQPFLSLQYLYGLARAERPEAETLLANIAVYARQAPTPSHAAWADVTLPASYALLAHASGQYAAAARGLEPVLTRLQTIGGSHAQRDLFWQIYLDALLGCGRLSDAQQILQLRYQSRPDSPLLKRQLQRVYRELGLPDF